MYSITGSRGVLFFTVFTALLILLLLFTKIPSAVLFFCCCFKGILIGLLIYLALESSSEEQEEKISRLSYAANVNRIYFEFFIVTWISVFLRLLKNINNGDITIIVLLSSIANYVYRDSDSNSKTSLTFRLLSHTRDTRANLFRIQYGGEFRKGIIECLFIFLQARHILL